jgi:hypothetical protein
MSSALVALAALFGTRDMSQAELVASLRLRIELLERKPAPDQRPDLACVLALIAK